MKKILIFLLGLILLNSCQNKDKVKNLTEENNATDTIKIAGSESNQTIKDTENAKEWLIKLSKHILKKIFKK